MSPRPRDTRALPTGEAGPHHGCDVCVADGLWCQASVTCPCAVWVLSLEKNVYPGALPVLTGLFVFCLLFLVLICTRLQRVLDVSALPDVSCVGVVSRPAFACHAAAGFRLQVRLGPWATCCAEQARVAASVPSLTPPDVQGGGISAPWGQAPEGSVPAAGDNIKCSENQLQRPFRGGADPLPRVRRLRVLLDPTEKPLPTLQAVRGGRARGPGGGREAASLAVALGSCQLRRPVSARAQVDGGLPPEVLPKDAPPHGLA